MTRRCLVAVLFCLPALAQTATTDWKQILAARLPLYGHRNWIVIADSAYPAQSSPSIETIVSGAGQLDVLRTVLNSIDKSQHVRPIVYLDKELPYVPDSAAPGVSSYRQQLNAVLKGHNPQPMLHEQIIDKLAQVSRDFRVLIIKTNMTIPYTSVFLELRASYWSDQNEQKLRQAMNQK